MRIFVWSDFMSAVYSGEWISATSLSMSFLVAALKVLEVSLFLISTKVHVVL
ncbi:MAG: hypothetical protein JRM79_00025 [Nitrososphaerota archaeon]|nr:hypothetical protein [Nitrososphaerota archaeon]MDG6945743.1 hypothetical protein [Nitrososphaerota archaeon]MDG6958040.1 hypothetical protein [Nitrososphaerota archaeon]MDG6977223.1 hypothetical protein [Nitrososphaerota archaeon]MDG6980399.1 hypothetical protein [Nitrososphaerota archaeon]